MRLFQNKSMRQSHCFYYYMDGMFLSECINKSFFGNQSVPTRKMRTDLSSIQVNMNIQVPPYGG